jgi:hypothetical protein
LVIIGSVNEGGEVLADGDIFVFGRLCGRVVAGLGGQGTGAGRARPESDGGSHQIFATSFEPSLVGIGSVFVVPDNHPACGRLRNKAVNVSLQSRGGSRGEGTEGGRTMSERGSATVSVPCEGEGDDDERTDVEMMFRIISL